MSETGYTLVEDPRALETAMRDIAAASRIGVDTEADSRHHYPEKVCLIQVATGEAAYVIDPLAIDDLSALGRVLSDPRVEKVLHGADYDVRGLDRDFGFGVKPLYDTNVAARLAGLERFGLAALMEDLLGIVIPKQAALQKSDWSRRPLSAEALSYGAEDVVHLGALRDNLDERLRGLGRQEWAAEECERLSAVRYSAPDPETAFLSVKGAGRLDGPALAVLRTLSEMREAEARRRNLPLAYVLSAEAMVHLAGHADAALAVVPGIGPATVRRLGDSIRRAVRAGQQAPPYARPRPETPPLPRLTSAEAKRLARLKAWRQAHGKRLALDPALLWPARSLERLARAPRTLDAETRSSDVRRWQAAEFGASLRELLDG